MRNCSFVLLALVLFAVKPLLSQTDCNGTSPCFTSVADILNGQRFVLKVDDLVFGGNVNAADPSGFVSSGTVFTTSSSTVSPVGFGVESGQQVTSNTIADSARMFSNGTAVGFRAFGSYPANGAVESYLTELIGATVDVAFPVKLLPVSGVPGSCQEKLYSTANDFAGNGNQQIIVGAYYPAGCLAPDNIGAMVFQGVAATNPANLAGGFTAGPASQPFDTYAHLFSLTSGTFSDPTAAGVFPLPQIAQVTTNHNTGQGLEIGFFSVDPTTLAVSYTGSSIALTLPSGDNQIAAVSAAAGRFSGSAHDQLIVAYAPSGGVAKYVLIDFNDGVPVQVGSAYSTNVQFAALPTNGYGYPGSILVRKAGFDFFAGSEEAVLSLSAGINGGPAFGLQAIRFDSNLDPLAGPVYNPGGNPCHYAFAVGNFDRSPDANGLPTNPDEQIADLSTQCTSSSPVTVTIYDVDPTTLAIGTKSTYSVPSSNIPAGPYYSPTLPTDNGLQLSLAAGDLEDRSLMLGPPSKAEVMGHSQPSLVLGVPPMQVDWIEPLDASKATVLNLSVYPRRFNASYAFSSTVSQMASSQKTTSYTVATKETASEEVSFGIPFIDGLTVTAKQALSQMHKKTVAKKYDTYSTLTNSFGANTVFDDLLFATTSRTNLYMYRVLGQCAPSKNAPGQEGCAAGTAPLYIQFSAPDNVYPYAGISAKNLEWYQPVQEPGNLFSYPGSLSQLAAVLPASTPLQAYTNSSIFDVQASSKESLDWTQGSGSGVSAGTVSTHSFDSSVSASASAAFDFVSGGASTSFDYNDSSSVGTLNDSVNTLDASQGVLLLFGTNSNYTGAAYDYTLTPVIYGQMAPTGTIDQDSSVDTDIKGQGFLDVGYSVNPLNNAFNGSFWTASYGAAPDIALNHPQRWQQKESSGVNSQQVKFECPVGYTSCFAATGFAGSASCRPNPNPNCSSQNDTAINVASVAGDPFYQIKGLFITPGTTSAGPQVTSVAQGKPVTLRVRVYNYSVVSPPATAKVRVQFYAQPWDESLAQFQTTPPATRNGKFANAIFIGESDLPPIPAYCGGLTSNNPCENLPPDNWVYAQTTWNTSTVEAGTAWKFWVVAWLENGNAVVPEIAGHGLPASTLKSCAGSGNPAVPCFQNLGQVAVASTMAGGEVDAYSNNFGFYNQVFSVLPSVATGVDKGTLALTGVRSPSGTVLYRDQVYRVEAVHTATGREYRNILARYYDGDPDRGGIEYDEERIPRIGGNSTYVDPGFYTPQSCGIHHLYVRSGLMDGSAPQMTQNLTVKVTADPLQSVIETIGYVENLKLDPPFRKELLGKLNQAVDDFKANRAERARCAIEEFLNLVRRHHECFPSGSVEKIEAQEKDLLECMVYASADLKSAP